MYDFVYVHVHIELPLLSSSRLAKLPSHSSCCMFVRLLLHHLSLTITGLPWAAARFGHLVFALGLCTLSQHVVFCNTSTIHAERWSETEKELCMCVCGVCTRACIRVCVRYPSQALQNPKILDRSPLDPHFPTLMLTEFTKMFELCKALSK